MKDVPAELAPGLAIVAVPTRADPRDAIVSREWRRAGGRFPPGSRVGTSSLRRVCQIRAMRDDLTVDILRGNVDTRLRKVAEGVVDAAVLACAGLDRLGFSARIAERLDEERMLPAIGQGALALEARAGDARVVSLCRALVRSGGGGHDRRRARAAGGPRRRLPHARRGARDAVGRSTDASPASSAAPTRRR